MGSVAQLDPEIQRGIRRVELKYRATQQAEAQGHSLGPWRERTFIDGSEVSRCGHCRRSVEIDISREPAICGQAVSQACRPVDPQLVNQHQADLRGASR